ncbi:MAG: DUF2461 domain-containing protein [Bacteroidales bacterium]|nr:DUF2461 domain-containing protein [Bacteroidales bacterium]
MSYIPELYDFLARLQANNSREWFKANKAEYDRLRQLWLNDIDLLVADMSQWWPELSGLTGKQCAYRIYRDTRFSVDKTPLKDYFSAGFSPDGRKAHDAGLYLQMGPSRGEDDIVSGLYGGVWCPESAVLKKLRRAIVDNIEEFEEIINAPAIQKYFPGWCASGSLKTVPKGYDRNHPQAHLLRLLDYGKFHATPMEYFLDPDWVKRTSELFSYLKPFVDFLSYSINEEV